MHSGFRKEEKIHKYKMCNNWQIISVTDSGLSVSKHVPKTASVFLRCTNRSTVSTTRSIIITLDLYSTDTALLKFLIPFSTTLEGKKKKKKNVN